MMTLNIIVLFLAAFIAGLSSFVFPKIRGKMYKLILVFAGAYLFSITIIHILPELYHHAGDPTIIGLYVLGGFFLQQVLEYFSTGAEHGHIHVNSAKHTHSRTSVFPIIIALSLHAFLEGTLLAHPSTIHDDHDAQALLLGIVLHKAPAAFALMTIVLCYLNSKKWALVLLTLFSLASPAGVLAGHYIVNADNVSANFFTILFGVVSGNFLHISTTIVFETNKDHDFNARKLGTAMLGALVAVLAEVWM